MWLFKKKNYQSDEDLARDYYMSGNKDLVGDLFEKHVKTVYGVCLFYFHDRQIAKDMVMQIFEKMLTELRRTEIKNFKGWLSFVVRNHCISELRKQKHRQFVPEAYLDFEVKQTTEETETVISSITEDELLVYMKESLPGLKDNQRICVELFYLQNLSYQEISVKTKLSLNEVKSNIQNGKRNLKLMIDEKIKKNNNAA